MAYLLATQFHKVKYEINKLEEIAFQRFNFGGYYWIV